MNALTKETNRDWAQATLRAKRGTKERALERTEAWCRWSAEKSGAPLPKASKFTFDPATGLGTFSETVRHAGYYEEIRGPRGGLKGHTWTAPRQEAVPCGPSILVPEHARPCFDVAKWAPVALGLAA